MAKTISENPKITDTVLFELTTSDTSGEAADPYKVDKVIIYFLSRDFISGNLTQYDRTIENETYTTYFDKAEVVKVFGDSTNPAWLSTDLDNAVMEKVDTGEFELYWRPEFAREGEYIVCWTWTYLEGDTPQSDYESFYLASDTQQTTSIPTHFTQEDKYSTLFERYTPDFLKLRLCQADMTPDVINKLNLSAADGFTLLEDLFNQIPDLIDSNAVQEQLILYLANTLGVPLRSNDVTLWRRQIKEAIPTYKQKGTQAGLESALAAAGINFRSLTRLWQVVSASTWQEAFVVEDVTEWELSKLAIISPLDGDNFEVYLLPAGESEYVVLTTDYVSFSNSGGVTTMTWVGDLLSVDPIVLVEGDIVRVIYKIAEPLDQSIEDYIRTLPLADQRDEVTVTYPPKNWNVRLIAEDDEMFDDIIPTRHPFADDVIWGKIRTEVPYSEKAYHMEEYNGSLRNSTDPCHIDKRFLDSCSACMSSKFNINIEIENISDARIDEAEEIIRDNVPLHAQVQTINYEASLSDYVLPPTESIECLLLYRGEENLVLGQGEFRRSNSSEIKRDMLASTSVEASATGTGTNDEIVLYSPNTNFDVGDLGIKPNDNLLEILSGTNAGSYTVTNRSRYFIKIDQASPDSISEPISTSAFTFRLSNELFSDTITSIAQNDLYMFSDEALNITTTNVEAGWSIQVTSPPANVGTYGIAAVYPNGSMRLSSWTGTADVTGVTYQLKNASSVNVGSPSSTGVMDVTRRGLVTASSAIKTDFGLKQGDYALVSGTQYQITEFPSASTFYITGYTGGSLGATAIKVYRRLLDNKVGYLSYNGMTLTTGTNYESSLGIANGANGAGITLENSSAKENYLVLIGSTYYKISEIDGTTITLSGPKLDWTLAGTSVNFSIIHVENQNVEVEGQEFYLIDRRTNEAVRYEVETGASMAVMAAAINKFNQGQPFSPVYQREQITCFIEYKE